MKENTIESGTYTNIRSMTGFGGGEALWQGRRVVIEVRTVNNRYLDVRCRLPEGWLSVESRVVSLASAYFKRGRVDVTVRLGETTDVEAARKSIGIDVAAVHALKESLDELAAGMGLAEGVDMAVLSQYRDLFILQQSAVPDTEGVWEQVRVGVEAAFEKCNEERIREGAALVSAIEVLMRDATEAVAVLDREKGMVIESGRQRFAERIAQLLQGSGVGGGLQGIDADEARVVAEAAVIAERYDITEETARLKVHMEEFSRLLAGAGAGAGEPEPVGRKLDFLLQELMREANTSGAKIGFPELSGVVVGLKSALERIREQVQNIE